MIRIEFGITKTHIVGIPKLSINNSVFGIFITDAFETGDARHIAGALGVVARAKGMTKVARATGLAREQLYKTLSETGNPTLETTLAVMKAIGFEMTGKRLAA